MIDWDAEIQRAQDALGEVQAEQFRRQGDLRTLVRLRALMESDEQPEKPGLVKRVLGFPSPISR